MLKKAIIFCVIGACFMHMNAYGVPQCPTTATNEQECIVENGCEWNAPICNYCSEDYWFDSTTHKCKKCNDGNEYTDYTSEAGTTTGENACKKQCGDKDRFQNGTWAPDVVSIERPAKCTYNNPENITCSANYYRDGNECKKCSTLGFAYIYSAGGNGGPEICYKTCQQKPISHGHLTPTNNIAYYDPQQPNNSDTCVYTTECDNPTDKCNGYHPKDQQCEYNVKNDTGCYQLYYSDTGWSDGCYRTQNYCSQQRQGFHGQECNNRYGQCYEETLSCANDNTITGRCDGGSVSGNIQQSEWQQFNYSGCECTKTDQPLYSGSTPIGTATMVYGYNRNGTINQTPTVTVQTCIAGYYANSNTCTPTQQDYYSGEGEIAQHKCPYGSKTTGTGSTSVDACSYPAQTTFKDKSGSTTRSFTLGVNAELSTAVKQSQQN